MMDRLNRLLQSGKYDFELEKVEDLVEIITQGVMTTPGLVIDGKLISQGKTYSDSKLEELVRKHL
jgi:hypothetical protein